ncbi:microfibril-associated glycoprotein 4-like [Drosophila navojoa]|nr:microfibril-associated glycoprotein 4-like [Drosophila navojoa]
MRALDLCILKLFLLILLAASYDFHETDANSTETCSSACLHEMKPLFRSNRETNEQLKAYEASMLEKKKQIEKIQKQLNAIQVQHSNTKDELMQALNKAQAEDKNSIESMKAQLNANTETLRLVLNEIASLNSSISDSCYKELAKDLAINCIPFEESSDVHDIFVHGFGNLSVRCDAETAGSGWLVVQRRFSGRVDFYRNWAEYKKGFGDLNDEFFIGLEALHHLTKSLPYELYVSLVDFDENIRYARYDNFLIGSEQENYMLKSLGTYTGNARNSLSYNLHDDFTTYDRDNDRWPQGNCAAHYRSGWWYNLYGNSNLNGQYFNERVHSEQGIWWYDWHGYYSLKSVQMMIRPKYTSM